MPTLFFTRDRARFFAVPDDAAQTHGSIQVLDISQNSRSLTEKDAVVWEIDKESADKLFSEQASAQAAAATQMFAELGQLLRAVANPAAVSSPSTAAICSGVQT